MEDAAKIKENIKKLVKEYFDSNRSAFLKSNVEYPLSLPSYDWEEVSEAVDSLLAGWVTMGKKVQDFEREFAKYIGVKHAVMVHSGSSANLLSMSVLSNPALENSLKLGDEVITPAVTWATTAFPIINCGAKPVFVDVDRETFNIRADQIENAVTEKTKAIMPVHLLGNPCSMKEISEIAEKHNLFVIEDACESHGAEYFGKKTGSFGDISTFSFFFSHHISTIEGGMVMTDNDEIAELAKALRTFGWVRHLAKQDELVKKYEHIDPRFLFVNIGYNFRPTEIQGAFGVHQIGKLDRFVEARRENAKYWIEELGNIEQITLQRERENTKHVWFGFPITVNGKAKFSRKELVDFLATKGIETRPIMSGNITEQPAMKLFDHRSVGSLENSKFVHRNSFFFGNHHGIDEKGRVYIADQIKDFVGARK